MYFIIDGQLPIKLAFFLRNTGYNADHVTELGLSGTSDKKIAEKAISNNAIIITKDEDFILKSNIGLIEFPIIWIRFGNTTNKVLWEKIEPLLPIISLEIQNGEKIIEIN